MATEKWAQVKEVFDAALRHKPEERPQFLNEVCADNETVRREVESLLSSFDHAEGFMQQPVVGEMAEAATIKKHVFATGQCLSHYEIIGLIGAGGMGEVYLAKDTQLERTVALKVLPVEVAADRERMRRFVQEAKSISALNHPNIITIHEIGQTDGTHFIATEYIKGETLRERLKRESFTLSETLDIAVQIAAALSAAHEAGIIHRDIKPENIMLRDDGLVKVLDFGLAKLTAHRRETLDREASTLAQVQTNPGMILGTVAYMSPEQARGQAVDARTDIWSLGCVLYEMLAGHAPFAGETMTDLLVAIVERDPPPLKTLATEPFPDEFDWIINKTLHKNKEGRYQTSKELRIDLRRLKERLEFEARLELSGPPQAKGKTAETDFRTTREHKAWWYGFIPARRAIVFAAVLMAIVAGALTYNWGWKQPSVAPQPEIKSLAVLPLRSLDASENYLGLGVADAIIRRISQTGKLIVRPTSAVRRYLHEETDALTAARQLEVDAVIDGIVQRADDRLRVSVNLLRVSDGASLWADSFDTRASDIFTIQDTMAQQVASRLQLRLDPAAQERLAKRYTSNAVAYEYYVRGVYSFDQRGSGIKAKPQMEATIDLFKKAIVIDPNYALAHAQLAYAYAWTALFIEPLEPVWTERAKEEISRAQALDPQLAEIHLARHLVLWGAYEGHQTEAAIRELLLAQQLNPNIGHAELAHLSAHLGLEDLAAREYQRALEIDPTSEFIKRAIVNDYFIVNKYDEWLAAKQKFLNGKPDVWYFLGKNRLDEAQTQLEELLTKDPDSPWARSMKGILLALKGDFRAAEGEIPFILSKQPVKELPYHHITYDIACIYALAGKSDEAVKWLRETAATGFPCYPLFERDPYLNRIRQAPEFVQFMAEMKEQFERYKREFAQ